MKRYLTYKDLKHELRGDLSIDPWGHAMGAWFDIANELWYRRAAIPEHWEYRPAGPYARDPREPGSAWYSVARESKTRDLRRMGNLLERYTRILKLKGEDY